MVSYFVVGPDGSKYGPADEFVLQEWIAQNRLTSTMELEDARTGERILAGYVRELKFPDAQRLAPQAPSAASPGANPSYQPPGNPYGQQQQPFVAQPQTMVSPQSTAPFGAPFGAQQLANPYGQQQGPYAGQGPGQYYRQTGFVTTDTTPPITDKKNGVALMALAGIIFLIGVGFLIYSFNTEAYTPRDETVMKIGGMILAAICAVTGGITFLIGYGMRQSRRWAFILGIVFYSIGLLLSLLTLSPYGIVLGVYVIWYSSVRLSGKKGPIPY